MHRMPQTATIQALVLSFSKLTLTVTRVRYNDNNITISQATPRSLSWHVQTGISAADYL